MPSASAELRELMNKRFGDPVDDSGPIEYLQEVGYKFDRDGMIQPKPGVTCLKDMTEDEFVCLLFLVHEWDYGTPMK